jgi:hypothetical protein
MKIYKIFLFFFIASVILAGFCYSSELQPTRIIEGTVAEIDTIASIIVLSAYSNAIPIYVPPQTKITRGTQKISIKEMDIEDPLRIEYFVNASGDNEAVSIIDSNLAEDFIQQ